MAIKDYRDLEVWQAGIRLSLAIYQVTKRFPPEERFDLATSYNAGVSIPSNVAEGYAQRALTRF
ncbi:MAG: four helix bundle protein [Caldilineaceae bacterium]